MRLTHLLWSVKSLIAIPQGVSREGATLNLDRFEVIRRYDGQLHVSQYIQGMLLREYKCDEMHLLEQLIDWKGWKILLHRSTWGLLNQMRAAGHTVERAQA